MLFPRQQRRGTTVVESAVVFPFTLFFFLGLIVGAMGVFRFQEVAFLSREAARWASVHGAQYQKETGKPAATAQDIYNNCIAANAVSLDLSMLTYSVTWNTGNQPFHTASVNGSLANVANTVTVTVNYQWVPEALPFLGPITLSSTSVATMAF